MEHVITYLPHGELHIPVIYLRWAFMDCSTILSKTELKTFRCPYYVPAKIAGIFHWLVSQASLLTRKPPIANSFWTASFSILNYLITDLPSSVPDARMDRAVLSYITDEYFALPWVHFFAIHYLVYDFGSPCFHYVAVPSIPTEKRARSSDFQHRSVMILEWSLSLPIYSRV